MPFSQTLLAASIELDNNTTFLHGATAGLLPGDTIYVLAGNRNMINMVNIQGAPGAPIVLINKGGRVHINATSNDGIKLNGCAFLHITGSGVAGLNYGFDIQSLHIGIHGFKETTDIEIDHCEIRNNSVGIMIKSPGNLRGIFVQRNTLVHHNYIHHTSAEGIYLGSSFYTNGMTHLLDYTDVYENIVEHTGWDGIQVGSASTNCWVRNNYIAYDSQARAGFQMSGIMLNPGSACDCFNNVILNGEGAGIFEQGLGNTRIYNNLIVRAGLNGDPYRPRGLDGIAIWGLNRTYSAGNSIYVYNNTIINPKNNGITLAYDPNIQGDDSYIANNIIINPGSLAYHTSNPSEAYVETMLNPQVTIENNIMTTDILYPQFVNAASDNYQLQAASPAVDAGINLAWFFGEDLAGNPRDNDFDIGAYEYQGGGFYDYSPNPSTTAPVDFDSPRAGVSSPEPNHRPAPPPQKTIDFSVYPNPASDYLYVTLDGTASYRLRLFGADGRTAYQSIIEPNTDTVEIDLSDLAAGAYIVVVEGENQMESTQLVVR